MLILKIRIFPARFKNAVNGFVLPDAHNGKDIAIGNLAVGAAQTGHCYGVVGIFDTNPGFYITESAAGCRIRQV